MRATCTVALLFLLVPTSAAGAPSPPAAATVPYVDVATRLRGAIDALDLTHLEPGYRAVCTRHGLDPDAPGLREQYRKARVLFEGVRDGGYLRLRWAVTNREPTSKNIWLQWRTEGFRANGDASATAECDELSTLYAFLGRSVGVRKLGVFYPTWNHAIAAWEPEAADGKRARILIPTSQIFLGCEHGFDETSFSPKAQRTVFEYTMPDVTPRERIPSALADALVEQVRRYGGAGEDVSALLRLHRAARFASSTGPCREWRRALAARVAPALRPADLVALAHYAKTELGHDERDPQRILSMLQ